MTTVALVTSDALEWRGEPASVALVEAGVLVARGNQDAQTLAWSDVLGAAVEQGELRIHTCPRADRGRRVLDSIAVAASDASLLERLATAIRFLAHNPWSPSRTLHDVLRHTPHTRKCLVLINPVGGTGKAAQVFDQVRGFFDRAGVDIVTKRTERQAHATDIGRDLDLTAFDFLVCVGGDGLACEVVQGFMQRKDWYNAIRFPLGIIPGGSGNGLAKTLADDAHEAFCPETLAYLAVKGRPQPMDMASIRSGDKTCFSFLSLAWAFIADVDLESERFRCLGGARFTVSAVAKVLSFKRWGGTLAYVPASDSGDPVPQYWATHPPDGPAPCLDLVSAKYAENDTHGVAWTTISGDFSFFWATSVASPSSDCLIAPGARLNDGFVHIVAVPERASLVTMTKVLLGLETGAHVHCPSVRIIKTRAYELLPNDKNDLSVDGERFRGDTIQVEVHRGLGRILTLPYDA